MKREAIISQLGGIKLKNIDLTGISIEQQTQKVSEEDNELIKAITNRDKDNAIEEFWDCVQVRLGALDIAMGIKAQEVMEGYPKHLEKIKLRPRIKACSKCINKNGCALYSDLAHRKEEHAKKCKIYKESEA